MAVIVQRAGARQDRELDERLQQEDARIAAGSAPPAHEGAPAPGAPRSRATSDVAEDGPIHQSETRGVDERNSSSVRRPADLGNEPQSRKAARSTPTSNDSWSPNSKRSRGLPRGTSQADYNTWMRANRGPMSYSPDNPPPDSGDADAGSTTHEDLLILSAIVRGVDIMEVYSPPRVTEVCRKYWLEPGESLDLKSGWDLSDRREQQRARALIRSRAPLLVICSPPCTKSSNLQKP